MMFDDDSGVDSKRWHEYTKTPSKKDNMQRPARHIVILFTLGYRDNAKHARLRVGGQIEVRSEDELGVAIWTRVGESNGMPSAQTLVELALKKVFSDLPLTSAATMYPPGVREMPGAADVIEIDLGTVTP